MDLLSWPKEKLYFFLQKKLKFTNRESEIAEAALLGYKTKEIADKLCIVEGTVANHFQNLYSKTGTHNKSEFLLWLMRQASLHQ